MPATRPARGKETEMKETPFESFRARATAWAVEEDRRQAEVGWWRYWAGVVAAWCGMSAVAAAVIAAICFIAAQV